MGMFLAFPKNRKNWHTYIVFIWDLTVIYWNQALDTIPLKNKE